MIKILIVDDSAFMRQMLKRTINRDSELKTIATAINGADALRKIKEYEPDVVTLDIDMPVKDGLETLEEVIKLDKPLPVIILSALDTRDTVMQALELGAFDFIAKPSGKISLNIDEIKEKLLKKIKAAHKSRTDDAKSPEIKDASVRKLPINKNTNYPIIAIGSSSGGPKALKKMLSSFPEDFPAGFIIVQHMPAGFTTSLAKRLNDNSGLQVKEARENDTINPGQALVAPGDFHLTVNEQQKVKLDQRPKKWGVRPCVDYMMSSLAPIFEERIIGIILTGMGHDGAAGMKEIQQHNGYGIVEDKSTALVYGMPSAAIKAGAYNEVLPLPGIGKRLIDIVERSSK
ncbi:MAG: protein-glutamate methylesterase/protein-glutamine glutaminase [Halanaerobiales bacterium]